MGSSRWVRHPRDEFLDPRNCTHEIATFRATAPWLSFLPVSLCGSTRKPGRSPPESHLAASQCYANRPGAFVIKTSNACHASAKLANFTLRGEPYRQE